MNNKVCYAAIKWILTGAFVLLLTGCATPSNYAAMCVSRNEVRVAENKTLTKKICLVNLTGGKKSIIVSKVDNEGFSKAIENSLANMGYLSPDSSVAPYQLRVSLEDLKQPILGLDLKVVCKAKYSLYDNKLKKTVFEQTLTTPYTAPFSSAYMADERLRLANEGAVKENIKAFLKELNTI